ncbi:MAG: TonB-dependent siderophore receptor [Janthinobacterium lividum]
MSHLSSAVLLTSVALPLLGQAQAPVHPETRSAHAPHHRLGTIVGRVALADGQPADRVAVLVRGTTHGTTPDAAGNFRLEAPAGWQVLTFTGLGYSAQEITVEVVAGQAITAPTLTLARGNRQLDEVTVTGTKTLNQRPAAVGKLPVAPLDVPQASLTVEREVLEQQQVLRLSDVLVNTPGVYVSGATGGTQEEISSRGFAYTSNNTFKNGVRYNNAILPETSSLERLEVLKGSAAILYGNVAAGGVLNLVTKKPQFARGGSVGLRVGSFGLVKPTFDVYGGVGNSQQAAFRLNGSFERADSYRDQVKSNRFYVNPSVLFNLSGKTTLLLEGDYLRDRRTPDFGIGAIDYQIQESRSRFLNTSDALNATQQTSATATLNSRLNDTWSVRAIGGFQRYDNELRSAARPTSILNGATKTSLRGNWGRSLQRTATAENYYLAELDLTGQFRTGSLGHVLLVGADADQYNTNTLAYASQLYDSLNILNPSRQLGKPKGATTGYDALNLATRTLGNTRRAGFYAQDLVSLRPGLKLLAGLRWSYQETPSDVYTYAAPTAQGAVTATVKENRRYDQAFSPRLGLVYQPFKSTAVFGSYSNSFSPNTGIDANNTNLPPSLIDQYEVGVKNDLFDGALAANVTLYRIVNSNQTQTILPTAPNYNRNVPTAQELAGEVTSKGLEVDVQSKPYLGWSVLAGYSYNQTAYTNSTLYASGSRLRYNPAHTANLSVYYSFSNASGLGVFKGLSIGATGYYVGNRLAGRNNRLVNPTTGLPWTAASPEPFQLIALPNYLLFDANVAYSYQRFTLRARLANLLNELSYNVHDDNSINPIAPRTYSAALSFRL